MSVEKLQKIIDRIKNLKNLIQKVKRQRNPGIVKKGIAPPDQEAENNAWYEAWSHPVMTEIRRSLLEYGYAFDLDRRHPSETRDDMWWAFGYIGSEEVVVKLYRPDGKLWSIEDLIFIAAHELRHAQHKAQGMFKSYYADKHRDAEEAGKYSKHFKTALKAERDCDRWAGRFVKRRLPGARPLLANRLYPEWRVVDNFLPDEPRYKKFLVTSSASSDDRPTGLEPDLFGGMFNG